MIEPKLSTSRRTLIVIVSLTGFVLVSIAIGMMWFPPDKQDKQGGKPVTPPGGETGRTEELPAHYTELRKAARDAQIKEDWCLAQEEFQKLSDKLASDKSKLVELRDEVDRNQRMLKTLCPGEVTPQSIPIPDKGEEVAVPAKKSPPDKLPEEVLLKRYPVGKTIRSVGHFIVNGKGRNTQWGFRNEASFSYLCQIPTETRVVEKDARAGRLVFEQSFGEVVQVRAVSNKTLELVPPDSLVLRIVWPTAEGQLKRLSPGYVVFRTVAAALSATDPGLKKTLTTASEWLRRAGINVTTQTPDTELAVQVEKLSGSRLKIVYVSGLGVTRISRLEGVPFNRDELIRLAHASTVLVDYFVFPTAKRREGEKWDVRADDLGSLFAVYDPSAEIGGTISLRREKDEVANQVAQLEVVDGTVTASSTVDGKEQSGRLTVRDGKMWFDLKDVYVRRASIKFSASTLHQSRDHLLFGTEQMRDLKVESRYEAELVAPATAPPPVNLP